MKLKLICH
ncbi:16a65b6b-a78d-41f0-a35c-47ff2ad1dd86 [Thermothielavioides terrestris]|uniref:16a65b6b-a78d-41f0-a35c-47ff2ad1dd86 n=1 Tax=Thermothielavioides terrestris TaxID=2587410 RepID=A0A3S4AVQ5_9PEZI|nr:16a65b6b-a78d-41f0-a35c-47ff2ad1dd86 [Thermothielavioides terrestris]